MPGKDQALESLGLLEGWAIPFLAPTTRHSLAHAKFHSLAHSHSLAHATRKFHSLAHADHAFLLVGWGGVG